MGREIRPQPAQGARIAIVVAQFNESVTERLLAGARELLQQHGGEADVYWVPGAFEIPAVARQMCEGGEYDGVLTLGALIRGESGHYDVLATSVTNALQSIAWTSPVPLCFGVLTCENIEQAFDRAGGRHGNKGSETMESLLKMVYLSTQTTAED